MNIKNKMEIYIRFSAMEQFEQGYSIDEKEKLLSEYCKSQGWEVENVYTDGGIGGKDIQNRPALKQMLRDAEDKKLIWYLFGK